MRPASAPAPIFRRFSLRRRARHAAELSGNGAFRPAPGGTPPGETPADPPYPRPCRGLHSLPQSALHAAVCTPRRGLLPSAGDDADGRDENACFHKSYRTRAGQASPLPRTPHEGTRALLSLPPPPGLPLACALSLPPRPVPPELTSRTSRRRPPPLGPPSPASAQPRPGLRTKEPVLCCLFRPPADGPGLRSVSAPAAGASPSVLCARHAFFRNAAAARDAPKTGKGMPLSGHPFLLFCISTATGCAALPARQTEPPLRNPWASTVTFPEGNAPARYRYQRLATLMRAMARARASSARCTSVSGLGSDRRCSARALACSARSTSMSAASSAASASTVILLSAT